MCTSVCVCVWFCVPLHTVWGGVQLLECATIVCVIVCMLLLASTCLVNHESGVLVEVPSINAAPRELHCRVCGAYSTDLVSQLERLGA